MWLSLSVTSQSPNLRLTHSLAYLRARQEWFVWGKKYLYCVPTWRVTDWLTEKTAEKLQDWTPAVCVRVYLHLKKALSTMITQGNLKTWMWAVGNVFCFIETFTIPTTLNDDSEVMLLVYDGTEMSYIWKCDWNALKSLFFKVYDEMDVFLFFFRCLNYIFFV